MPQLFVHVDSIQGITEYCRTLFVGKCSFVRDNVGGLGHICLFIYAQK